LLYKYRDINSFKNFTDIIVNSRLYAAPYFDLNDPMEGQYLYNENDDFNSDIEKILKGSKDRTRICSLSKDQDNQLMWAHYANGHRGVVFGIEVDTIKYETREVAYDGPLLLNRIQSNSAIEILSHKLQAWSYEQEVRVFINSGNFVNVSIEKVICGSRMSNPDYSIVSKLCNKFIPHAEIIRNN
jgi:hypothetical protein